MSAQAIKVLKELCSRKVTAGDDSIVMVTAYDAPTARFAYEGGADIVLVGDSAAMVMLGYESTMAMKPEEMEMFVAAVSRTGTPLPVIADMVWGSYHVSIEETIKHAIALVRLGAHAVKIEGGMERVETIEALVKAQIPVVAHVGLTPQSILELGSYGVQGKDLSHAQKVLNDARAVEQAGASMIVVECVPDALSRVISEELSIPVIGIGAGRHVDGQVLVMHDLLGITAGSKPKFVRRFAQLHEYAVEAVREYSDRVRDSSFPSSDETYHMADDVVTEMHKKSDTPVLSDNDLNRENESEATSEV